jgi:GTP pyrophosphokinase
MTASEAEAAPVGVQPEALYKDLEARVLQLRPSEDTALMRQAFEFAAKCHAGQKRDSGEPYITHPLSVALILTEMNLDQVALCTALLHDTVEDTSVRIDEVRKLFGNEVAHCVDGVTKLGKVKMYSVEERQAENVRKMLLAMVTDIRVILVKLADRLHNMRTLGSLSAERKLRIAQETLEIYAPIAHRLGMGKIRAELEDLAFLNAEPEEAAELTRQIESRRMASEESLQQMKQTIAVKLQREGVVARVDGRVKRVYSVWQKLRRQKIGLDQVYDIMGLRIITDSVKNCYGALGVIHNEWHPIPGRIKDFIAIPRPNLYQSLHTSVIGPGGLSFEIQIRTEEMHRIAEEGIAAHWKYKEGKKGPGEDDQRIAWLRQLVEWQREMRDPGEFMSTFKVDMYQEEVYCFTPRGRVIILPRDASPVDFAYAIHTDVGHNCVGAKVNGRIVPLRAQLRSGDVVEVLTQTGHQPSKDWLGFVKTSRARNKIRQVIKATERERAIEIGQKALERESRRLSVPMSRIPKEDFEKAASDHGYPKVEDLQAAIGYGKVTARAIMQRFAPEQPGAPAQQAPPAGTAPGARGANGDLALQVKGADDLLTYRAKCCNPIRGEPIVGYITRGKGVAVHATTCPNVNNLMYETERRIEVEWARTLQEAFRVNLAVYSEDRPGILNRLTSVLTHENSNIRSLEARGDDKRGADAAIVEMSVEVRDKKQLERVMTAMRRIPGVRDVERVQ